MRFNRQKILNLDRWVRGFAWGSVVITGVDLAGVLIMVIYISMNQGLDNNPGLTGFNPFLRYGTIILMGIFYILFAFGLSRLIHFLLAYRDGLAHKMKTKSSLDA